MSAIVNRRPLAVDRRRALQPAADAVADRRLVALGGGAEGGVVAGGHGRVHGARVRVQGGLEVPVRAFELLLPFRHVTQAVLVVLDLAHEVVDALLVGGVHHLVVVAGDERRAGQEEGRLDREVVAAVVVLDEHSQLGLGEVLDHPRQGVHVGLHAGDRVGRQGTLVGVNLHAQRFARVVMAHK